MEISKKYRTLVAGLALLAGAGAAQAWETETGLVKIGITTSGSFDADAVEITMATPDPMSTGRCNSMFIELVGEGNKAIYSALLAANIAGKAVTLEYVLNEDDSCTLAWLRVS